MTANIRDLLDNPRAAGPLTAWVTYPNDGGEPFEVLLRQMSADEIRRASKKGGGSNAMAMRFAGCVLDWKDWADTDGEAIVYSSTRAKSLMKIDAEFSDFVVTEARKLTNFRPTTRAAEAGDVVAGAEGVGSQE